MDKKNNKETPQDIMKMLMFQARARRVEEHMDSVVDNKACVEDSKKLFDKLETEKSRFHYIESHLFGWAAVMSDDLCDIMENITYLNDKLHDISKRLDKLDGTAEDDEDDEDGNGDNDFTFGGF